MRKLLFFIVSTFSCVHLLLAQSPVVKVDLNMSGRTDAEVNDPNYVAWVPDNAVSISKSISGVTFTFKKTGSNGTALRADWYKVGVQAPNYARLICDGVVVDGGNAGAEIELTISGLSTGTHSMLLYHNSFADPASNSFAPIDVYVNGTLTINNLTPSNRAVSINAVASSYVTFNATAGKNVVLLYKAETSSSASMKNVYINGFELNTPNVKDQAKSPVPADGDRHVDGGTGSATLKWTAGSNATAHRVYFGTDKTCVETGTTSSACYKGQQGGTSYNVTGLYSMNTYYWRVDEVNSSGTVTKGNVWVFRPRQLAFPGAEGYGRFAIGGRGGKVVHVTNLKDDNNPGSLRYAVENETGPRTIVFDIGGMIALESRLVLSDPYVTVAGQTAPGKGICIRKAPFGFTGNDVIGRFMKVRLGAGPTYDGMGLTGANHSILDHCSISWTIDESFSSRGAKNITLQRTLISEALNAANHQNYPAGTEHGYAGTIGGDVGSFHHNLLAHNYGRNWSMGGGLDGNAYYAGRLDITNNVVYNWGGRTTDGGAMETNFVGNYYKPGAGSKIFVAMSIDHEGTGLGTQRGYFTGNVMPGYFDESTQTKGRRETYSNGDSKKYEGYVSAPFFPSYVTTQSAIDAYKSVLSDVGHTQPVFDDHDIRIVNETLNGTYKYKGSVTGKPGFPDKESDVGGYESYPTTTRASNWDTDGDGMPDFWEKGKGFNPNSTKGDFSESNGDPDKDGFTNLEDYLNWMAEYHYIIANTATQSINLTNMFMGYSKTSPAYSVSSTVNGTVNISGSTATFKPATCGFASFNLTVKDNAGGSMTRKVGVYVDGTCSTPTPTVALTAPASGKTYCQSDTVTLTANASVSSGTISKVDFYEGSTLIASDAESPYSVLWLPTSTGSKTLKAIATSSGSVASTASTVTVTVNSCDCNKTMNGTAIVDNCDRCVGGTTGKTACTLAGEAEIDACSFDGTVDNNNAGFKGTGFINVPNAIGSQITFHINSQSVGLKTLSFRYASGGTSDRKTTVTVNGTTLIGQLSFPATGAFTTYKILEVNLNLEAGTNIITLASATSDGLANIDQIGYVSEGLGKGECIITGIEDQTKVSSVSIFPNPSANNFNIRLNISADIEITNAEGKVFDTFKDVSEVEFGNELSPGVYFAKIQNKVYKFVKY